MQTHPLNVLIVDDHQMMLDGLSRLLQGHDEVCVRGTAGGGAAALDKLAEGTYDLVLLDISMPEMNGIETLSEIRKRKYPVKVIMITMHQDFTSAAGAIHKGADGYILKNSGVGEILKAVRVIRMGGMYISPEIQEMLRVMNDMRSDLSTLPNPYTILSERELQVAKLFARGQSSTEIATALYVSVSTVETHRRNIFNKLKINKTASLVKYLYENHLM